MREADLIVVADEVVTCAPGAVPRKGKQMSEVSVIRNGAVAIKDGIITAVGKSGEVLSEWGGDLMNFPRTTVVPGLVDCHTHPVFAGSRVDEFLLRAAGADYQEIHAAGGGILSTVRATRQASDEELKSYTRSVFERMMAHGTTTVEAKSGYGLRLEDELRQLRILRSLGEELPLDVVTTFLGAHAVPEEFKADPEAYVDEVVHVMVPQVAREGLADFADVFCEEGVFTVEQSERVLKACKEAGMGLRIHAEEFCYLGGAVMAARLGASSADHLHVLPEEDFEVLLQYGTIPVVLPGTSFFLGKPMTDLRKMVEAGLPVALGSDYNAGSCMSESLAMTVSLAVLQGKLTPEEALIAATVNAAHSLGLGKKIGSLEVGKQADLLVLDLPSWREWPYHFGVNLVRVVIKKGIAVNTVLTSPLGAPL